MTDSVENDVPVWCSEHMEPYCPRHAAENDRPTCPTCGARKVRTEGVWWCAMCDDCPPPTRPIPPGGKGQ